MNHSAIAIHTPAQVNAPALSVHGKHMNHAKDYRTDIDALRAIAVVSVMLFHSGLPEFSGGFVGVDIFFIISGYLISKIIISEVSRQEFSILKFYERRFRRIIPALMFMIMASTAVFCVILLPTDFKQFSYSIFSTLFFGSNIYFNMKSGYFDSSSEIKPLLHTWSLGVEEQFYIVFPLIIITVHKFKPHRIGTSLLCLIAVSFLFSLHQVKGNPESAFYLPFSRAWELLLGSWLACIALKDRRPGRRTSEILGATGLALLVIAITSYDSTTPFPGLLALVPCAGAALLIFSGASQTWVRALLSNPLFLYTGKISYSLYLWHWPLLVLFKYSFFRNMQGSEILPYLVATYVLASITYYLVETPIRVNHATINEKVIFICTAAFMLIGVIQAGLSYEFDGFPQRFDSNLRYLADAQIDTNTMRSTCNSISLDRLDRNDVCKIGDQGIDPSFAIIGDSFSDAIIPGFESSAIRNRTAGLVYSASGCYPLRGADQGNEYCKQYMDKAFEKIAANAQIRTVAIIARFTSAYHGSRFGQFPAENWFITDEFSRVKTLQENKNVFRRTLKISIAALKGKTIIIYAFFPEQQYEIPRAHVMHHLFGQPSSIDIDIQTHRQRQQEVRSEFELIRGSMEMPFRLVDVGEYLCTASACRTIIDHTVMYYDDNHLSASGSKKLVALWDHTTAAMPRLPPYVGASPVH